MAMASDDETTRFLWRVLTILSVIETSVVVAGLYVMPFDLWTLWIALPCGGMTAVVALLLWIGRYL